MQTRRQFFQNAALAAASLPLVVRSRRTLAETARGSYQNPIMGGDHPDASPIRVGEDFYLTHSSFDYAPGLLIWHSRDLVNWKPVNAALRGYYGGVWAPYLCEHMGHYYIYFPANNRLHVVHAGHPTAKWSEPLDLGIDAIDPGHVAAGNKRYLYMAGGLMAELSADGLSVAKPPRKVLDPWPVPKSIRMECTCMEAPKLLERNGWYYLTVAEGGTAGPGTSHAVVSARSRNAEGPWEFSPYNPVVHTASRDDRWLSLGHGRLVDTPAGDWYLTVHSYENGYRALGRQLLLMPVEWTPDGWWRARPDAKADGALPMPIPGATQQPWMDPSDDFTSAELGLHWSFWHEFDLERFRTGDGALVLKAKGRSLAESAALTTPVGGHSYTVEVDVEVTEGCEAGLMLFYDPQHACGIELGPEGLGVRVANGYIASRYEKGARRATLRVVNDRQEVDFWYRLPGGEWKRTDESAEIGGMQHNVLGGFLDVRPAIFAAGQGQATLRGFRYWAEARVPA